MIRTPQDIVAGKPIRASHIKELYRVLASLQLQVGPGLTHDPVTGTIGANPGQGFWIYISAQSGFNYTWLEKVPQASGAWADGPRSGTAASDPAIEVNSNATVALNTYQWAERSQGGDVLFQADLC